MKELERRRIATQATLDDFRDRQFDWQGDVCAHLFRRHMIEMGHEMPDMPEFDSPRSAIRAMKKLGWSNVQEMIDSMLDPIPPSMMLLGDIATVEGDGGLDAILICAGPLKVFGWREDHTKLVVIDIGMDQIKRAWRA